MRVLITGGNGFIGSTVVRLLHQEGHTIRCTLRETSNTSRIQSIPFERTIADIRDFRALQQAALDCDAIIHCASLSNWKDLGSPELKSIIVDGTKHLIQIANERDIRMVYLSSAAALGASQNKDEIRGPNSPFNLSSKHYRYAACKAEAEKLCTDACKNNQANIVMVHPTETYGPGDTDLVTGSTLVDFSKGPLCLTCKGGTSIAHVEDVATGIVSALTNGKSGEKYILGGENVTISEIAAITQKRNGTKFPEIRIPRFIMLAFVGIFSRIKIKALEPLITKYRYATHYWFFDNSQTLTDLKVTFRSAEATIADTLDWLKTRSDSK